LLQRQVFLGMFLFIFLFSSILLLIFFRWRWWAETAWFFRGVPPLLLLAALFMILSLFAFIRVQLVILVKFIWLINKSCCFSRGKGVVYDSIIIVLLARDLHSHSLSLLAWASCHRRFMLRHACYIQRILRILVQRRSLLMKYLRCLMLLNWRRSPRPVTRARVAPEVVKQLLATPLNRIIVRALVWMHTFACKYRWRFLQYSVVVSLRGFHHHLQLKCYISVLFFLLIILVLEFLDDQFFVARPFLYC